jgi:hypothetical protein
LQIEFFGDGGRNTGDRVLEGFSCSGRSHVETVFKPFDDCNNGWEPFQGTGSIQVFGFLSRRIIRGAGPTGYIGRPV